LRRTQKPFLRKKRSFKRQRSQAERNQAEWNQAGQGKHDLFLQAHQEAVRRVQEAEAAASRAAETATQIRTRAQLLMSNADLAAYKAAMALRIAEAIRVSSSSSLTGSPDLDSSILFD